MTHYSKYPPAKPEALWVAGPSKGPYRDPKSKSRASGSMLVADILEARSILLELSNFYCLPGRAGGSPVRTRFRTVSKEVLMNRRSTLLLILILVLVALTAPADEKKSA